MATERPNKAGRAGYASDHTTIGVLRTTRRLIDHIAEEKRWSISVTCDEAALALAQREGIDCLNSHSSVNLESGPASPSEAETVGTNKPDATGNTDDTQG